MVDMLKTLLSKLGAPLHDCSLEVSLEPLYISTLDVKADLSNRASELLPLSSNPSEIILPPNLIVALT
jgi:hypothetical protein